jgi:hypothetical protein
LSFSNVFLKVPVDEKKGWIRSEVKTTPVHQRHGFGVHYYENRCKYYGAWQSDMRQVPASYMSGSEGKKEEGRRKKEEGRGKKEEGRGKKEEGRRKKEEGRRKRERGREQR